MALNYPLAIPNIAHIASIKMSVRFMSSNTPTAYTLQDDTYRWPGTQITGLVTLKPMKRIDAEDWVGWQTSLKGHMGTFYIGDPQATAPLGTALNGTITGDAMDEGVTVAMSGTLARGDWLQIGVGADRTLHKVDQAASGNGDLDISPGLRKNRVAETFTTVNPTGVFRLPRQTAEWDVNRMSMYGITFPIQEAIG